MHYEEWSSEEQSEIVNIFLSHVSKLNPDKQAATIQLLIGGAVSYMPEYELHATKAELETQFPNDHPFVSSIIDIIDGQIALREMGFKPV